MALYEKIAAAMKKGDADAYLDCLHKDHVFVRHQTGAKMNKAETEKMIRSMTGSGAWKVSDQRCIYENDDILVTHSVMSFPDGTREAVMNVGLKKDGKLIRSETGATPLK